MSGPASRAIGVARRVLDALGTTRVVAVGEDGIHVVAHGEDRVVDVLFDDRRIWSFWLKRDTERLPRRLDSRFVAWPARMRPFMKGKAEIVVREHVSGTELHRGLCQFGTLDRRIAFRNAEGLEISLDKSLRFSPTFAVRTAEQLEPLLDGMDTVIAMLAEFGIQAFPAYGTLLGAIREGDFLGHDSDADLGYVSTCSTPVDMVRESFELQRAVAARGFATYRYSGGAIRIDVPESDGSVRGLDLFGGFFDHDRLYLLGEVGIPYREEWLYPFTTCTLAGREYPVVAEPERLLEAMYGPGWRVPDPAFKFETPRETVRRLNDWFRGMTVYRRDWERHLIGAGRKPPTAGPSDLAQYVAGHAPPEATVLDVGAGRCGDALWLAQQGRSVIALDYVPRAAIGALQKAREEGVALESRMLNLTDYRSVLPEGARAVREPGPHVMLARHVLDATNQTGRDGLMRYASMALRGRGTLYADFLIGGADRPFGLRPVAADRVVALAESSGGTVVSLDPVASADGSDQQIRRMVAQWA